MADEEKRRPGRPLNSPNKKKKQAPKVKKSKEELAQEYKNKKARAALRDQELSAVGRDIGIIPKCLNPERREKCRLNLRLYLEIYHPIIFHKPWSPDHLLAIAKIERAILEGGLFALCMPRGSGKTSIIEGAGEWALSYGHCHFVAIIGATEKMALDILDSIKFEYETNTLMLEDFPEICVPIRALEGATQKATGQMCQGQRTKIKWKGDETVFPTIIGSKSSGAIMKCAGITGSVRGMKRKMPTGEPKRPDFVLIDDPQTDDSARSFIQTQNRLSVITNAVLGLAGPGEKISAFIACTVITEGDLSDQILNQDLHRKWQGQRTRMVISFPTNKEIWKEYEKIYDKSFKQFGDVRLATIFYKENHASMSEGAEVSWPERFNDDEYDGIQHAMNIMIDDEYMFWAEYQGQPKNRGIDDTMMAKPMEIVQRLNGVDRYEVPHGSQLITVGIDVQKYCFYYVVKAWKPDGTNAVIDYGTYPDQGREYFLYNDVKKTIIGMGGGGWESDLYAGLENFIPLLMEKEWMTNDKTILHVDQILIDANWHKSKTPIYDYCRASPYKNIVMPGHGTYYGAKKRPMSDITPKSGEQLGDHWLLTYPKTAQSVRLIRFDTNHWKTWTHERISTPIGAEGAMTFFGKDTNKIQMYADQVTAEFVTKVSANGREVEEWTHRVSKPDNHLLDAECMAAVGASMRGLKIGGKDKKESKKQKRQESMSQRLARNRRNRGQR